MSVSTHTAARFSWTVIAGMILSLAGMTFGQTATRPARVNEPTAEQPAAPRGPQIGRIKGDNVYVRSGSHLNYYPVTKLNRGDTVTVVGEQYGWLEIEAPEGTFSLIDKTYVDRTGDSGTLNGDRWVNAGSALVEDSRYAKQAKLKKGDTVRILGETKDGAFYKIAPPPGAHLWVKADFVEGVTLTGAAPAPRAPERVEPGTLDIDGDTAGPVATRPAGGSPSTRPSAGEGGIVMRPTTGARTNQGRTPRDSARPRTPSTSDTFQPQISAIEAEIQAENTRPVAQRSYERVLSKLRPMATQKDDEVAALYAQTRIKQIEGYVERQEAAKEIARLRDAAIRDADKIADVRARLPKPDPVEPLDMIVVRGEIRVSSVYEGTAGRPKRWRIVDPSSGYAARTLAYIELPEDSPINPTDYYGKYVGIRAIARQVSSDTIPPIPVYTVSEIVVLDASARPMRTGGGSTAIASPPSRPIPAQSTRPTSTAPAADDDADRSEDPQ